MEIKIAVRSLTKNDIRSITKGDIDKCAGLLMQSYNRSPWDYNWNFEMAAKYLDEYLANTRFVGFALCDDENKIIGAMFGHSKTWWTNDLLYIDELFISPEYQKRGYGKLMLDHCEGYAKKEGYEFVSLMTNKYMPAYKFYNNLDYIHSEHFVFMFKQV
ncbi:MAG: GNAT family N-acetyltransferase [Mucilaginibacter sp.]